MGKASGSWNRVWAIAAVVGGIGLMMLLEIIEEPDMTLAEILFETLEPTLMVMTVAAARNGPESSRIRLH